MHTHESPPRAVLFDLYNTLVDIDVDEQSNRLWSPVRDYLKATAAEEILREQYEALCDTHKARQHESVLEKVFPELIQRFSQNPEATPVGLARVFRRASRTRLRLRRFARPLIADLKERGYRTAIVSNTEAILTRVDLGDLGITDLVDVIVLSSDIGAEKPDREPFEAALSALAVSARDAVFIGDSYEADAEGALAAGMSAALLERRSDRHRPKQEGFLGTVKPLRPALLKVIDEFEKSAA